MWSDVNNSPFDEDYSGKNTEDYSFNSSADSKEKILNASEEGQM